MSNDETKKYKFKKKRKKVNLDESSKPMLISQIHSPLNLIL